mmetsp:Transcript_22419/g.52645  ORF Transcript_22419/g.52645 Transcript_22419/m.52645 type:complete len:123 (-) Transcript_22419:368-736(-)
MRRLLARLRSGSGCIALSATFGVSLPRVTVAGFDTALEAPCGSASDWLHADGVCDGVSTTPRTKRGGESGKPSAPSNCQCASQGPGCCGATMAASTVSLPPTGVGACIAVAIKSGGGHKEPL